MKRASALLIIIAFLITGLLSGCEYSQKAPVTVTFWHVYGEQADSPLNLLVDEFNRTIGAKRGIIVNVTSVEPVFELGNNLIAAANNEPGAAELPDIFSAYEDTAMIVDKDDTLVDFNDYFSKEELSSYVPQFLEGGEINGKLAVFPVAKSMDVGFLNKTAFDRFSAATGVTADSLKTFEGINLAAQKYREYTSSQPGGEKPFYIIDSPLAYFQLGVAGIGGNLFEGDLLNFECEGFDRVFENYAASSIRGEAAIFDGYGSDLMLTEDILLSIGSSAGILYTKDSVTHADNTSEDIELSVTSYPSFEGGAETALRQGVGLCVKKSTPEKERAAATFIKWLTEPKVNTDFVTTAGYIPVQEQAYEEALPQKLSKLTSPKYKALYTAVMDTYADTTFYSVPRSARYSQMRNEFTKELKAILLKARQEYIDNDSDPALLNSLISNANIELKTRLSAFCVDNEVG
ncbi:MAG: extracellular solute-binding protein [Oscillospiraceae bacterium]